MVSTYFATSRFHGVPIANHFLVVFFLENSSFLNHSIDLYNHVFNLCHISRITILNGFTIFIFNFCFEAPTSFSSCARSLRFLTRIALTRLHFTLFLVLGSTRLTKPFFIFFLFCTFVHRCHYPSYFNQYCYSPAAHINNSPLTTAIYNISKYWRLLS